MDLNLEDCNLEAACVFAWISVCNEIFPNDEFAKPSPELRTKERSLRHLIKRFEQNKVLRAEVYAKVFAMVQRNLFRCFQKHEPICYDIEEECYDFNDPAWPHIGLVYQMFRSFLMSSDFNIELAKPFIDKKFIIELFKLFDSPDMRERDEVQYFTCLIYENFEDLQELMLKQVSDVLLTVLYESHQHYGIAHILEVARKMLELSNKSFRDIFIRLLFKVFLPLYKLDIFFLYNQSLTGCMIDYILIYPQMAAPIILLGLFKYWPKCDSNKEYLFWEALNDILEKIDQAAFMQTRKALIRRLTQALKCTSSRSFNAALGVLLNTNLLIIIHKDPQQFFAEIIPALVKLKLTESPMIQLETIDLIDSILQDFEKRHSLLYNDCLLLSYKSPRIES